ncbi:MAG: sensor histidine kinase, partial [Chloroflexota bacterium]
MSRLARLSLSSRIPLAVLAALIAAGLSLALVLARQFNTQLVSSAQDRLRKDEPVVRAYLEEARFRDLRLISILATNPRIVSGTASHNSGLLDKVVGPLRGQLGLPGASFLAVVSPAGQIVAADPFTSLPLAGDLPVREALANRANGNIATTRNALFLYRPAYPDLAIEAAWPVRVNGKRVGALVLLNQISDDVFRQALNNPGLGSSQLQAGLVVPGSKGPVLAAATPALRTLAQQKKLPALLPDAAASLHKGKVAGTPPFFTSSPFPVWAGQVEGRKALPPAQPLRARLVVGVAATDLRAASNAARRQLLLAAAAAVVVLALLMLLAARLLLRPLTHLRAAAEGFLQGRPVPVLSENGPRDLALLAAALNRLAADRDVALKAQGSRGNDVEAIIDSMTEGVVVSDAHRRVTLVNPVAKRLLGLNGANGALPGDLVALNSGARTPVELTSGSRVIKSQSAPIISPDGQISGYVSLLHDASQEAELDRLKSDFVGVVSHELRTPLTSMKGSVDLLLDDESGDLNATQRRFLNTIRRSTDRLINLVNDLLDLNRLEAGRVQLDLHPVDARQLVEDTLTALGNLFAAKKQSVRTEAEPRLPLVLADRQRLEQVLVNLLGNASKYTPEGGEVAVAMRAEGQRVAIDVSDTGPGLGPE